MARKIGIALGICIAAFVGLAAVLPLLARPVPEEKLRELGVIEPDSLFVDVDGVKTRYVEKGAGEGAIIFIHGFSSSLFTWRACLDSIAQQYRVYALDLKGFGFSGKPESDYTIDEYVDFVAAFMDELELPSAILCGNSMGGNIAWRVALKHPNRVDALILVDASGYPSDHSGLPLFVRLGRLPGAKTFFGVLTTRSRIRDSLESAYFEDAKVSDRAVDSYYYSMKNEGAMHAVLARLRSHSNETARWHEKIPSLSMPTLIVWGDKDTWIPLENAHKFHNDIAGSELVVLPGCGHLPQEEFPDEFAARVLEFLSKRERVATDDSPLPRNVMNVRKLLTALPQECHYL
jgi:pimeloyl-ACP methyl ester carboxylesterase